MEEATLCSKRKLSNFIIFNFFSENENIITNLKDSGVISLTSSRAVCNTFFSPSVLSKLITVKKMQSSKLVRMQNSDSHYMKYSFKWYIDLGFLLIIFDLDFLR